MVVEPIKDPYFSVVYISYKQKKLIKHVGMVSNVC